ncbi:aspartyl protease family protein [Sphingopyxis panaciterrae]|uniref:retropepsin-like aspartic protease family protein n=1 Tax=Sphingopyxis panaciterrae TaxID=363841 RepID=UPI00141EE324|nr:retropepsin-like aspartic protease [Sphingopyxis panaciterrae]NIJ37236.1 aspartyl protease family protein [Sphingopyxis panaciterrae]
MLGRFLGLAAIIAALSVGMAGIAGRSMNGAAEPPASAGGGDDNSNWTTERKHRGGWSSAAPAKLAAGKSSSGAVRIDRAGDSHFYADADIGGTSIRMMVDSGASIVALTRRDAETIGIDVDRLPVSGTARTAGGDVPMRTVMLDSVEIGGIEVRGVEAAVVDADMGVSLLGQSYLAKLDAVNVEGDTMTLR